VVAFFVLFFVFCFCFCFCFCFLFFLFFLFVAAAAAAATMHACSFFVLSSGEWIVRGSTVGEP